MNSTGMKKIFITTFLALIISASAFAYSSSGSEKGKRRMGPPEEAFTVCADKEEGDEVEFTGRRGDTVKGTCEMIEGRLAAVPENMGNGRRPE